MSKDSTDLNRINDLIKIMNENDLIEVTIKHGDDKIALKRANPNPVHPTAVPSDAGLSAVPLSSETHRGSGTTPEKMSEDDLLTITSPIVGTFYEAPSPDSNAYVEVGAHVSSSTVVCIIEAMKVMNEIKAEVSGTIVHVLVSNGQAVEFGQALFKVKPA